MFQNSFLQNYKSIEFVKNIHNIFCVYLSDWICLFSGLPNENKAQWSISSVQSLNHVQLVVTPWIAACQAFLFITISRSSLIFMSIESVMPSNHLILCCPLHLLPPIPPSIRVFSSESTLRMRWPKYWSFSFSIIPSKEIPGLQSAYEDWEVQTLASSPCHHLDHRLIAAQARLGCGLSLDLPK